MMMDDVGALIWRFGKKLIVSHAESDEHPIPQHAADHNGPPTIVHPAAE